MSAVSSDEGNSMIVGMADVGAPCSFYVTNVILSGTKNVIVTWMGSSTSLVLWLTVFA